MKAILRKSMIGLLTVFMAAMFLPSNASSGKREGRHGGYSRGNYHYSHNRPYHRYPHGSYHYWPSYSFFFGSPFYPGWYNSWYYGYPAYTPESILVYKEDPGQYGLLRVDIRPPQTEIFVDGRFLGTAEFLRERATSLMIGTHQLQLKLGPYSRYYPIQVDPNSTAAFSKDLSAE